MWGILKKWRAIGSGQLHECLTYRRLMEESLIMDDLVKERKPILIINELWAIKIEPFNMTE